MWRITSSFFVLQLRLLSSLGFHVKFEVRSGTCESRLGPGDGGPVGILSRVLETSGWLGALNAFDSAERRL